MLAANRSTAYWLQERSIAAPFVSHAGFRSEKLETLAAVMAKLYPDFNYGDPQQLGDYIALIRHVNETEADAPSYEILSRMLEKSCLSVNPKPHMGLGFACYATFTSPIRKFQDFLLHRAIKAELFSQPAKPVDEKQLESLQETINRSRQASRQLEQWFKCQLIGKSLGKEFDVEIHHIHSRGFNLYLQEFDITGSLDAKSMSKNHSFDPQLLEIKLNDQTFKIGQRMRVKLESIAEQYHTPRFMPA